MPVTQQEAADLKTQGWTDEEIAGAIPAPSQSNGQISGPQTIGRTLKAHGGAILGGGAGAIGASWLLGPEVGLPVSIGAGIIGALGGGYAGQKAQQAIESPETYEAQQLAAQQAAEQHPNIAEGTDITAGALASGGMFSPTTAVKGVGGIIGKLTGRGAGALIAEQKGLIGQAAKAMASGSQEDINAIASRLGTVNKALPSALEQSKAAQQVLLQSALNPAISTGLSLAQGQGMPSASELGKQALGGAMFAKSWMPHGRLGEPNPEINNSELANDGSQEPTSKPWVSPFTAVDDAGDYKIGNKQIQSLFKKKDSGFLQPVPKDADAITKAYINTANEKLATLPVDQMRDMLHQKAMGEKANDIAGVNESEAGLRNAESISQEVSSKLPKSQEYKGIVQSAPSHPESDFISNAAYMIQHPEEMGLYKNQSGVFSGTQLLGTLKNKITPVEWDLLQKAGIEKAFEGRKISGDEAAKWIQDNEPKAQVVSYGMTGEVSEAEKEYDKMTHEWYDTVPTGMKQNYDEALMNHGRKHMKEALTGKYGWSNDNAIKAIKYADLQVEANKEKLADKSPRATSAYSHVSALPTNEPMPEWTTTKSGKNVQRVDVVVPPKPGYQSKAEQMSGDNWKTKEQTGVLWQPDNLHENLPNTFGWAMIQYKTGPNGEKIAVIAEVQSRLGQQMRYEKDALNRLDPDLAEMQKGETERRNHPLLKDYNRLILKAVIEQARKEGATHIMVSDAETAMMTQGHDAAAPVPRRAIDTGRRGDMGGAIVRYEPTGESATEADIRQAPGMRLNYDTILPKIAEELTGNKGEKVSLGEHKNAMRPADDLFQGTSQARPKATPRDNLIFRNPDGTPKTNVSGMMYPIDKVPNRNPKLFGKNYSPLSDYNRYQELDRQRVAMESKITDPEELMANPEHQAISRELKSIKNKYQGQVPPQFPENHVLMPVQLQSHILNDRATTGSVLHGLANTPGHPLQELASKLLEASDSKSLQVKWNHDPSLDSSMDESQRSHYDPITDRVNIGTGSAGDARVVMEEAIHSLTSKKIPFFKGQGEEHYNRLNTYLKNGSNEHVKDLIRCYFETAKALGIHDPLFKDKPYQGMTKEEMTNEPRNVVDIPNEKFLGLAGNPDAVTKAELGFGHNTKYAMGNLDEFIAQAFKDPEFQRVLEGIKTTDNRTVWQTIVNAVKNLLGLDAKAGSMLERVLRTSGELVHQERPEEIFGDHWSKKNVNAPPKEGEHVNPELKPFFGRAGRFFQNAIERARTVAPEVSDAYHRFYNARSEIFGKVYGNVKNVMNRTGFTTEDGKRLIEAQRQEELTGKPIATTFFKNNAQRQVWNEYKLRYKEQGEEAVKDKQPVYDYNQHQLRVRQLSDTSHPMMLNPKVGEILRANTDTAKVNELKQDFLANQKLHKISLKDAQNNLNLQLKSIQGTPSGSGDLNHFKANRIAQGIPLPPSWQRNNFEQNLRSYASANANDRANYKYIESNPSVMRQLGETHDAWNRPLPPSDKPIVSGNSQIRSLIGESRKEVGTQGFFTERAGSALATAWFIVSPALSAVHVPISNICGAISLTRNPIEAGQMLTKAFKGMYDGVATAGKNGIVVPMAKPVSDIWDSSLTTAEHFQAMSSLVRRFGSLNDIVTKGNIGYMQSAMEFLVPKRLAQANYGEGVGSKTSQQWLRKLDPDYTIGKQYSPDEIQQLASRAVGYLHGTNDPRSMPEWMMRDSEISGFFSIAHWSVAQTDRFMRDVWTPATKGDLTPLVASMFGATIGGYIIKELREQISGKHSPIPSIQEIAASDRQFKGNAGPLAYNMISALQYAGFGGVFSQIAKWPFDVAYKNIPQAAAFPLDEEITDIGSTLSNVASALANDPNINYVDLAKNVMAHVLTSDFRLAREGYNQLINNGMITGTLAEKKALSDKMGQLRRFEQVEGLPFNAQDASNANPYINIEQKKFKLEQDPKKAMAMLPGLISNIIQNYSNTPDVMMSKLKALKENSYSTFPSIEEMPLSFFKYIGYLNREEGPEAANKELQDYMKRKIVNEAKSSVVP